MKGPSPFKFLNAYEKEDRAIFFGRDSEIEELYEMAHESNLILVYGRSGTGKTSLLQCGLANRFLASDWMDISIRRNDNINDSVLASLRRRASQQKKSTRSSLKDRLRKRRSATVAASAEQTEGQAVSDSASPAIQLLNELYTSHFKPVYLIFDQFEELFILGSEEEQQQFYDSVAEILEKCTFCHLLFVLREESIAQLYDFERVVPELFEKRIRVEPLSRASAVDVVVNTTSKFDIGLEDQSVAEKVIQTISAGKGRAELTYLQVFLDAMYQAADDDNVVFTHDLVERLGGIEDVLADFLKSQSDRIQAELEQKWPGVTSRALRNVLNSFVTLEGTKQPMVLEELKVPGLTSEHVEFCVKQLDDARILRFAEDRYELRHDALAARIAASRSTVDVAFMEAVKLVKDRTKAFKTTNTYLSEGEISFVKAFDKRMRDEGGLTADENAYVKASVREARRKRMRRVRQVAAVGALMFVGLIAVVIMYVQANNSQYARLIDMGDNQRDNNNYREAVLSFSEAIEVRDTEEAQMKLAEAERLEGIYDGFSERERIATRLHYRARLDSVGGWTYFQDCDSLIFARQLLTEALETEIEGDARNRVENRLNAVNNDLTMAQGDLERRAEVMRKPNDRLSNSMALGYYQKALEISPEHVALQLKVDELERALEEMIQ